MIFICIQPLPTKPCIETFSHEKMLFCPFAIFLESLKVLFSYTMKSIFLENKYLMFNKESFVSSHQCNDQCVIDKYLVNKQKDLPTPPLP